MIRGTTAKFTYKLPCLKEELAWATIKFWQDGNPNELLPIFKNLSHCDAPADSAMVCVSLTAEETLRFSEQYKAKTQIRAERIKDGTVFGCKPQIITVYPMDDDIVDSDPTLPAENEEGVVILDGGSIAK